MCRSKYSQHPFIWEGEGMAFRWMCVLSNLMMGKIKEKILKYFVDVLGHSPLASCDPAGLHVVPIPMLGPCATVQYFSFCCFPPLSSTTLCFAWEYKPAMLSDLGFTLTTFYLLRACRATTGLSSYLQGTLTEVPFEWISASTSVHNWCYLCDCGGLKKVADANYDSWIKAPNLQRHSL